MFFIDYYSLFEIDPSATLAEVKSAFKKQALKWHPDKNPGIDTTEVMQNINEAYLILKDAEARKLYDIEYKRFQNYKKQEKDRTNNQEEKKSTNSSSQNFNNDEAKENYAVFDETLKKWIKNARQQAVILAKQTIEDLREMSIDSGKVIVKSILSGVVKYFVLIIVIAIFIKACG
jgi:DnaJ-class molecular chaperone